MNGLAFDWATKNVYWTDGRYKVIGVMSMSGANSRMWKTVVHSNLSSPQDVAVNPLLQ